MSEGRRECALGGFVWMRSDLGRVQFGCEMLNQVRRGFSTGAQEVCVLESILSCGLLKHVQY
jgi:hypothetical protein